MGRLSSTDHDDLIRSPPLFFPFFTIFYTYFSNLFIYERRFFLEEEQVLQYLLNRVNNQNSREVGNSGYQKTD